MVSVIPQSMADHVFNPTSGLTRSPQVGFLWVSEWLLFKVK
jgi:hypothetical protein